MAKKNKDSNKGIKDRIKKQVPTNDWFLNVGKSMGFATQELVQELMPNTYSTVDWNKNVINIADLVQDIRDNNGVRKMFSKQLGNVATFKIAKEGIENAKSDFKSGNWYNKNRAMGMNDDGDFNFDDFSFDSGGVEFIDDDDDGNNEEPMRDSSDNGRPPTTIINTMPLAKAISSSTEATVGAIASLGEQNMAMETEKLMMNKQTYESSMSALNSINENLALLVQFNSDSTAKYQAAALKYFEQSLELMEKPEEDKKKKNLWNPFTAEGGLKLDEYANVIKENLVDIKDSNIAVSTVYDLLDNPELLKGFTDNPIGTLLTSIGRGVINKKFKDAKGKLSELDKNLNMIMPAALARINQFENTDDSLLQTLNKVFGYKYKLSYDVDLGDYEKGAISWDGESKKALVEVIPSYLRRIESVLTGNDERIYNYSTGKFDDINSIEKFYNDKIAETEVSGFTNVRSSINEVVNNLGLSVDAKDQVMKDFNNYFRAMTKQGYLIRHNDPRDNLKFSQVVDYDKDREMLLKRILDEVPNHIKAEMATMAISDSRERTNNLMEEVRANPTLTSYSYLNNDLDKDGKMRYTASKMPLGLTPDKFGLNQLDYLRDIRSALIKGIRVFPDHTRRGRGNQPNADIISREYQEQVEYDNRVAEEKARRQEESQYTEYRQQGRSVREAANIPDSNWKEMFKEETPIDQAEYLTAMDKLNKKVDNAVYNLLYGEDEYQEKALQKLTRMYQKGKPIMQNMKDFYGDTLKAFRCFFTGQGYVTSDGVRIEGEDSLIGSIKTSILGIKDKFTEAREGGMFNRFFDDFMDGFDTFKTSLFGEKALSESKSKETFQDLMAKVKLRLPKALGYGLAGGMVKTMFASNLGLLGNFLMPGGPIGSVLMGTTFGFLKQSETFNRYMFGEQDENGNRVGGLISKAWQDKYQEYKGVIAKGAGIGILGSLFLPGGPVAGAILGAAGGIASKNEAFQEFLYGKDFRTDDKKSWANGAFGKALKNLSGGDDPKLAKFLGTTGLGIGVAQGIGLLPSFLLPGGPIMGAMLGLAGGIAASSNKFQEFLLGEKDIDGKRYGGLITKAANWFSLTFAQPLKLKFTEFNDFLYGMFRKHIFDPMARSFQPILHGVKNVFINAKDSLVEAFTSITHPIVEAFKENIIDPVANVVKKAILNPLKWMMKKTFGFLTKSLVGLITAPISILGRTADKFNEYSAVRQEKFRRRREYDKNTPKEERNYYDRKRAGKLTKEEKQEAIAKGVSYRKGKTWKEMKKEQNVNLKEEMTKRKDRRKEMARQFEEDKKFAKETGYKYRSKKQQEKREQELREKEIWFQEQQLMQAQDTDEKVEKISDNVIQLSDYQNNTNDRLDTIVNTVRDGFNKLAERLGLSSPVDEVVEEDHMDAIYDFLDKETARDENITLKEALDDLKGEFREVLGHLRETDAVDTSSSAGINPNEIVNISDSDLSKIYNFLNTSLQNDENITLRGALDNLPADFKEVFKNRKADETVDTGDNRIIDFNAVRKQLRDDDQSHADGLDLVPSDGYLAELHEGEMVVPEKPAGKLRNLMDKAGKGFGGLTDILSETSEDDVEHREDESGMIEKSLRKGALGFGKMIAGAMGGISSTFGKIGSFFGKMSGDERRDREDNALQLSDMEADRLKEIEDKARYDHASRKNVDFIQEQIAADNKEKADRKWKDALLNSVKHLGGIAAAGVGAGMNLFDLLKNGLDGLLGGIGGLGGLLGSLALPAGIESLIKMGNDFINSEEYQKGYTDVDADGDGEGDKISNNWEIQKWRTRISARNAYLKPLKIAKQKVYDPLKEVGGKAVNKIKTVGSKAVDKVKSTKLYQNTASKIKSSKLYENVTSSNIYNKLFNKGTAESADNVIDLAAKRAAKEGTESAGTKVFKEVAEDGTGKVINFAEQKLLKEAAEGGSGKAVSKIVGETAEAAAENKGLISKIIKMTKQGIDFLADLVVKKFPAAGGIASKLHKLVEPMLNTLLKNSDNVIAKFGKKITSTLGSKTVGAATGGILDAAFAVGDLITGITAGNAGNLFGVSPENVDARMRIISSIFQAFFNFSYIAIVSLVNEITNAMYNYNFLRQLAIAVYNFTGGKAEFGMRITAAEIDKCTSIEEALQKMGITDPNEIAMLRDGNDWKDFSSVKNEDLGGVITAAEQMELARLQYNLANGTQISSQGWIDKEAKTVGSKVMDIGRKLFSRDTAQQKYNKLTNKAAKKSDKANEYREKASQSKTIFGKAYNNTMAWLNDKSAAKAEKKAEKLKKKAAKKVAKAESKLEYHTEKAENSKGIFKTYHNWRAKKAQKKIDKYTISDGKVTQSSAAGGTDLSGAPIKEEVPIMDPELVTMDLTMVEGDTVEDEYGNVYDHTGQCIYSPNWDHAGMGDGDDTLYDQDGNPVNPDVIRTDEDGNMYDVNGKPVTKGKSKQTSKKKSGKLKKLWDGTKNLFKSGATKVGQGIKKGVTKAGEEIKDYYSNPVAYALNKTNSLVKAGYKNFKTNQERKKALKEKAKDELKKGLGKVKDGIGAGIDKIKNNKKVKEVSGKLKSIATAGIDEDDSAGTKAAKVVKNINKAIKEAKEKMLKDITNSVKETMTNIGKAFKELGTNMVKKIGEVKDGIINGFKNGIESIKTGFKNTVTNIGEGISTKVNELKTTFSKENLQKKLDTKVSEVKTAWGNLTGTFNTIFGDLTKKFSDWKDKFSNFKLPSLKLSDISVKWKDVTTFFKDFAKELFSAGSSGPKPSDNKPIKPIKHNISSTELLKPVDSSTTNNNTTMSKTNNKFVFYNQSDARWGQEKIGDRFMKDAGCGPTSLAMAVSQLTGEQITPDTIAKLGQDHLPGYAQYSLFPSIAEKLDMNYTEGQDTNFITRNLKQGIPVLLSGKTNSTGTPYTSEGHVVTASHMKGNMVYIQDPRGEQYSRYYPINSLMTGLNKGMILTPSRRTDVSRLSSSETPTGIETNPIFNKQELGIFGDIGEYQGLNDLDKNSGRTGASQITMADRVLSYARAFLNNTSKFSYSQPRRLQIDNNKSSSKGCGADCSSFVSHVLSRAGDVNIYGTTSQTFWDKVGTKVTDPQIGDVVCQVGHVGLYSGNGNYIHMSGRKAGIKESKAIQNGNNKHRGYKRVLKNPSQMVDPTVPNANTFLGTVVGTSSGNPVGGGSGDSGTTDTTGGTTSSVPQIDELGIFGKLKNIGTNYLASIYNGKEVDLYANTGTTDTSSGTTTTTDGSTPDISGISDTATAVWKFFTGKGYSPYATAGIMGNLQQESSMDPTKKQSGGGPGRGIAQWTVSEGRFKGLQSHAKSKGKDWTDLQSQLEWIDMELGGKDATTANILKKNYGGLDGLKKATSTKWAVEAFEKSFERAGKPMWEKRYKYADDYYNKLNSAGAGPAIATSAESAPSDGSIPNSMNGWKFYQQSDSRWAGQVGSSTVSRGGCGPTSAAMMLSTIFGKEINPLTMTKWAHSNGTWTGAMQWSMPDKVASTFGLGIQDLGSNANGAPASTLTKVKESLKAGKPVMLTGRGTGASGSNARMDTPFTPGGHVVLAVGLDGSGNIIINDPRGAKRTKAYTDDGIMNVGVGLRGAWAFNPDGGSIPSNITTDGDFTGGGSYSGGTTDGTTDGGTASSAPQIDELGVFAKLKNIGTNYLASIYNGKEVDLYANTGSSDTSGGGTTNGSTPTGSTSWNGTKYDLSKYNMNGLSSTKQNHINKMIHPTLHTYKTHGLFPSLTFAQAAQESGWGLTSGLATKGNAAFGIKADKSWTGKVYTAKTREVYNGKSVTITDGFRAYDNLEESIIDRANFLKANSRYTNAGVFSASSPEEQARAFQKAGYATDPGYASSLISLMNGSNLQRFDKPKPPVEDNAGSGDGDGNTYLVQPNGGVKKYPTGDAGKGDGKVTYSKSVTSSRSVSKADVKAQRELEAINRKVNVAFNNINASDPNAYAEVLRIILQELQAINSNTAATAEGVGSIEIASANAPVTENKQITTKDTYQASKKQKQISKLQTINSSTGYSTARQIAGYKKSQ